MVSMNYDYRGGTTATTASSKDWYNDCIIYCDTTRLIESDSIEDLRVKAIIKEKFRLKSINKERNIFNKGKLYTNRLSLGVNIMEKPIRDRDRKEKPKIEIKKKKRKFPFKKREHLFTK